MIYINPKAQQVTSGPMIGWFYESNRQATKPDPLPGKTSTETVLRRIREIAQNSDIAWWQLAQVRTDAEGVYNQCRAKVCRVYRVLSWALNLVGYKTTWAKVNLAYQDTMSAIHAREQAIQEGQRRARLQANANLRELH